MGIVIPNKQTKQLTQYNRSDVLGVIDRSFNLELKANEGRIRVNSMKNVENNDDDDSRVNMPVAIEFYDGDYWFLTEDEIFQGSGAAGNAYAPETGIGSPNGEPNKNVSDMTVFNGALYLSGDNEIMKFNGSWSTPVTTQLTSSRPHLMTVYKDTLYVTDDYYYVHSVNTSDVISASGANTINLGLGNTYSISMLKAGYDRIWIGVINTLDGTGYMYDWDGQTENIYRNRYDLEAGCIAGVIFNNVPHIIDAKGRLMAFNGGSFQEVARIPNKTQYRFDSALELDNQRFVHPNGMDVTDYGTILININTNLEGGLTVAHEAPSGVWEYDPSIGLYHKNSLRYSRTGVTTFTDYGQQLVYGVEGGGALRYLPSNSSTSSTNGTYLAGGRAYLKGSTESDDFYGLFIDDTLDTTEKYGFLETTWLESDQVEDVWQEVVVKCKKLLNSGDKIVVKYRVDYDEPTLASITWSDTDTFTTTDDLSAYVAGDEIEVYRGVGAGKCAHISSISEAGGTYTVNLDDTFTGVTASATARVFVTKWIKLGEIDQQNKRWERFTVPKDSNSPQIKLKVCMQFTGKNELHEIIAVNRTNTKI